MDRLKETINAIRPLDGSYLEKAQRRLDNLTKPRGSLGRLEEFARKIVAIREELHPRFDKKRVVTFAADHGIAEEGISSFPKEVTHQMVMNFLRGGAGINVLARHVGAEVMVVDIGVDHDFGNVEGLIVKKVRRGTGNISIGPAMERMEAIKSIIVGIELADMAHNDGCDVIGVGEMGIGNTTPSSAILSAITGMEVSSVTSRGTGIDDSQLAKKIRLIEKALQINRPDPADPIDCLAKVGGLEIGAIAGMVLGCAAHRIPIVIDGFISTAGALIAYKLNPFVRDYTFASHLSAERGHRIMLDHMNLSPMFDLNLRLGEGTGAALGIGILEASIKIINEMATFESAGVSEAKGE
ncbi:MAG: nicotinate-nucleotide--dimethylbenzimidazole phosphoribosyltransferase [Candidatus Bathyarchaeia archaeon]